MVKRHMAWSYGGHMSNSYGGHMSNSYGGHLAHPYGQVEAINRKRWREFNTFSKTLSLLKNSLSPFQVTTTRIKATVATTKATTTNSQDQPYKWVEHTNLINMINRNE